jgi:glutamyl-tRNA reductase
MNVTVIGANHRTMPMALRERLAIGRDRLPKLLADLQSRFAPEAVVLSTCNRVEIYLAGLSDELLPDKSALAVWFAESPDGWWFACIWRQRNSAGGAANLSLPAPTA